LTGRVGRPYLHQMTEIVTRFAPSPTGRLHLGHAYAALFAARAAEEAAGRFLLRLEDIDIARCRPAFARALRRGRPARAVRCGKVLRIRGAHR